MRDILLVGVATVPGSDSILADAHRDGTSGSATSLIRGPVVFCADRIFWYNGIVAMVRRSRSVMNDRVCGVGRVRHIPRGGSLRWYRRRCWWYKPPPSFAQLSAKPHERFPKFISTPSIHTAPPKRVLIRVLQTFPQVRRSGSPCGARERTWINSASPVPSSSFLRLLCWANLRDIATSIYVNL